MATQNPILLLSDFTPTAEAVGAALEKQFGYPEVCHTIFDLVQRLEHDSAAAVLVDLDPQPMRVLQAIEPLTNQYGRARFIALADIVTPDTMVRAMEVGVRQCMAKGAIAGELAATVKRLMPGHGNASRGFGSAVTVLSAGGGCGATTLAVNLAHELQLNGQGPAMLVDLDAAYGAVAAYLGLKGQYGLADVLAHSAQIDSELIHSTAMRFSENLHALLSPASVDFSNAKPVDYTRLDRMMEVCRRDYRWVVVDAPRVSMPVAAQLAAAGQATFIVCQLSVKDIRCARDIGNALAERDVRPGSIRYVAGRFRKGRGVLTLEQASRALGVEKMELLHDDFNSATDCVNLGQTLEQCAPRSALRSDVRAIHESLVNPPKPAPALIEAR